MLWVILSILAAFFWAVSSIVDKYILTKWVSKPLIPVTVLGIVGLVASLLVYLFHGFTDLSHFNIILAFIAGIFYILMCVFYFKAVMIGKVSRVYPLFYLSSLFVLLFAGMFLGESFTLMKYLGIFLLVACSILISLKEFKISFGKPILFMVLSALALSINAILTKYLLNFADFWTIFSYTRIGTIVALIPIFYFSFPELVSTVKRYRGKVIGIISANETLNLVSVLLITIALSVGHVSLVSALSSFDAFFVLLLAVILSRFYPKIYLKKEIGTPTLLLRFIAIILMFAGALLII